jgi:tetratricopeptide (TPR) repeat protein
MGFVAPILPAFAPVTTRCHRLTFAPVHLAAVKLPPVSPTLIDQSSNQRRGWNHAAAPAAAPAPAGPALAAAGAALLVYAVTLAGTFVYDDIYIITVDPRISHPRQWIHFWTQGYFASAIDHLYRPLVSMSYALQWRVWGDHPAAYHVVNWLLHAAVAAAVAELARRLAGQAVGYIAGLLFAVHPVHVEAVAQVVGRAELCCALGVIGALVLLARRPLTPARVAAIVACQVLALLSKEQGVLLPALLLLQGWLLWRRPGSSAPTPAEKQSLRYLAIALTWGIAAYLITREHFLRFEWDRSFLDWGMQPMVRSLGHDRTLMPLVLLGHYAMLLIFPWRLSPDYGANVIGSTVRWSDPYLWLGCAAVAAWLLATIAAALRRRRFALFCLIALALLYGMLGNILTLIGVNLAERLMYLPSAFFLMLIALPLARLPRRPRVVLVAVLLVTGALRSVTYARLWNDRLTLFAAALAQQPRSSQLHMLLIQELLNRGNLPAAQQLADRATRAFPDYGPVWIQRADIELQAGQLESAQQSLSRAFVLSPSLAVGVMQQEVAQQLAAKHPPATQTTPLPPTTKPTFPTPPNRITKLAPPPPSRQK